MPAKDLYHDTVKKALIKDGWTITHEGSVFQSTLEEPIARPALEDLSISLLVFDPLQEVIIRWKP